MMLFLIFLGLLASQPPAPAQGTADAALLESAKLGRLARAKELLAGGAGVNSTDRRGFTPLMWAAASGDPAVLRLLIDSGAALDVRANDGTTALLLASANGFTEIARVLLERGADVNASRGGVSARQLASERGHADLVTLLAQAEVLGVRLLKAAAEGHDTLVRQVLAAGAPVNVSDERGATALMMAARNGDLGILQVLLSRGADASARDHRGQTVL